MVSFKEFLIAEGDVVPFKGKSDSSTNTRHFIDKEVAAFPAKEKQAVTSAMRNLRAAMEKNPAPASHSDKTARMAQLEKMVGSKHTSPEDKKWAEEQIEKLEATGSKQFGSKVTY